MMEIFLLLQIQEQYQGTYGIANSNNITNIINTGTNKMNANKLELR